MSLWLHRKIHNISLLLWMRAIWIVFVVHISLLLALFFCYRNDVLINYVIQQGSAPIIISDSCAVSKKNYKEKQITAVTQKKVSSLPKKEVKLEDKKVSVSKIEPKKKAVTPVDQKKKLEQKSSDKQLEKKEVVPEQKNPVLESQKEELEKKELGKEQKKSLQTKENVTPKEVDEAARQCAVLHNELLSRWRAPHGVKNDIACTIHFSVNFEGKIENVVIEKSSGILLFDIAAKGVIYGTPMPRWVRGKSMTITFN